MKRFPYASDAPPKIVAEGLLERGWTLGDVLEWFAGRRCCGCPKCMVPSLEPFIRRERPDPCPNDYSDPPAEYARDVLCAYIEAHGNQNPRWVEWVKEISTYRILEYNDGGTAYWYVDPETPHIPHLTPNRARLSMKRRVLEKFSGPVEDKDCDCHNGTLRRIGSPEGVWEGHGCLKCHGSGIIEGGGVRIARDNEHHRWVFNDESEEFKHMEHYFCCVCGVCDEMDGEFVDSGCRTHITPEQLLPPE